MQTRIRIISQFIGNVLYSTTSSDDPQMGFDRRAYSCDGCHEVIV